MWIWTEAQKGFDVTHEFEIYMYRQVFGEILTNSDEKSVYTTSKLHRPPIFSLRKFYYLWTCQVQEVPG